MIEAIALLALVWAITATLVAARALARLGRAVHALAATLTELTAANDRTLTAMALNERWEELYVDLARRAGQPYTAVSPVTPPRDLVN